MSHQVPYPSRTSVPTVVFNEDTNYSRNARRTNQDNHHQRRKSYDPVYANFLARSNIPPPQPNPTFIRRGLPPQYQSPPQFPDESYTEDSEVEHALNEVRQQVSQPDLDRSLDRNNLNNLRRIKSNGGIPNMSALSDHPSTTPPPLSGMSTEQYLASKGYSPASPTGATPRRTHSQLAQDAHHRRTVSWDPPSIILPGNSAALTQLLREKKEALLLRERELLKVKERQQALRREQWAQAQAQQTPTVPPPQTLQPPPIRHARDSHHNRSKSDPNVIPLLLKVNQLQQLNKSRERHAAAVSPQHNYISPRQGQDPSRVGLTTSPRLSGTSQERHNPLSPLSLNDSLSGMSLTRINSSPHLSNGEAEIAELEELIGLRHKQLVEKGILPPISDRNSTDSSQKYLAGGVEYRVGGSGRVVLDRWEQRNENNNNIRDELIVPEEIITSLVEDIEEEIEWIRQKTQDIQDKVEILERVRCQAPDPVTMLFGDDGRVVGWRPHSSRRSPPNSPHYIYPSPTSFAPMDSLDYEDYVEFYQQMMLQQQQQNYVHPEGYYPSQHNNAHHQLPPQYNPSYTQDYLYEHPHESPVMFNPLSKENTSELQMNSENSLPVKNLSSTSSSPVGIPQHLRGPDRTKSFTLQSPRSAFSPPPRSFSTEEEMGLWQHDHSHSVTPNPGKNTSKNNSPNLTNLNYINTNNSNTNANNIPNNNRGDKT
eukprot:TRINITY_DN7265_c0_g1_i1.p1 TRINITY_DN7265_c0_g1~~TRINITY_DN7265_c0_g1_i1.p1  ORF type:complete len:709 (+),score=174.52 TRINITY_DN7265_c0_g1_i1:89-2215(+)